MGEGRNVGSSQQLHQGREMLDENLVSSSQWLFRAHKWCIQRGDPTSCPQWHPSTPSLLFPLFLVLNVGIGDRRDL